VATAGGAGRADDGGAEVGSGRVRGFTDTAAAAEGAGAAAGVESTAAAAGTDRGADREATCRTTVPATAASVASPAPTARRARLRAGLPNRSDEAELDERVVAFGAAESPASVSSDPRRSIGSPNVLLGDPVA
jgi:hypothetical protein